MEFILHPNLAKKEVIIDLPLCKVLLQDESLYPWIILVPRKIDVSRIMDLTKDNQLQLLNELDFAQKIIWELFSPAQLNVAAIGNKTPQLHIHVIARQINDSCWPNTVWDHPKSLPYTPQEKEKILLMMISAFNRYDKQLN